MERKNFVRITDRTWYRYYSDMFSIAEGAFEVGYLVNAVGNEPIVLTLAGLYIPVSLDSIVSITEEEYFKQSLKYGYYE